MLYIAYGVNVNPIFLRRRCPNAKYLDDGYLMGYKLTFRRRQGKSFVSLEESENNTDCVPAVLWLLSDSDARSLDKYVTSLCVFRKENATITCAKGTRKGIMYVMCGGERAFPPDDYFGCIVRGYALAGFDYAPLVEALRSVNPQRFDKAMKIVLEKLQVPL